MRLITKLGLCLRMTSAAMGTPPEQAKPKVPSWLPWFDHQRDSFKNSILKQVRGQEVSYFAFIFACQNPVFMCMSPVHMMESSEPFFGAVSVDMACLGSLDFHFERTQGQFPYSEDGFWTPVRIFPS